ncbi:hypothetical protein [Paenibacillus sp. RC67]|uniref:hypothetical protein n=1 Tax=Paenibacillus sp. RC67 TaxID=3039392 RepID=UPI0024AE6C6A|nr:hypothetical protein [Paenibacillus sp. RC67]
MLWRKSAVAYFTAWTMVLGVSFPYMTLGGEAWQAAGNYASWATIIALYAVPSIFLYGILVSSLLELAARKLNAAGPGEWLASGLMHVIFGLLFGFVLQSSLFSIMGGAAAILFFVIDRLWLMFLPYLKRKSRMLLLSAPILLLGIIVGTVYMLSPPKPPFTSLDAVAFATSGSGSTIDFFPKQVGVVKLQIEGYDVERETTVEGTDVQEQYLVHFIERWRKGEESGEYRMVYEVTRGSMGAKGGKGNQPPYQRSSYGYIRGIIDNYC